jgi:rhomboid family GlyGly-CTERM serine protease
MNRTLPRFGSAAARRVPCVSLAAVLAAVVIQLLPGAAEAFQYERAAVAAGEWWRVLTCHWTHFSFDHFLWDVLVLAFLGALCELRSRKAFLACVAGAAVGIPLAVHAWRPGLATYRGLSGIDAALFALLAVLVLRESLARGRRGWAAASGIAFLAFAAKIAFEMATATTVFVDSSAAGMVPVPLAHMIGAGAGLLTAALPAPALRSRANRRRPVTAACLRPSVLPAGGARVPG